MILAWNMGRPSSAGAARLRRAGFQGGGASAPKARGRHRPEDRLAHETQKGELILDLDQPPNGDLPSVSSVKSVESVDQLLILKTTA